MKSVVGAKGFSFFTPKQNVIGKLIEHSDATNKYLSKISDSNIKPKLFTPLRIRSMQIVNRIGVSPMCMYSSSNSCPTIFHSVHYGNFALRGAGLIIVESCAITQDSIFTPNDLGIWNESMAKEHYNKIVEFVHSQNGKIGIQLNNMDFIGNTNKNYIYIDNDNIAPEDLKQIVVKWGSAAKLAIDVAKYDFIEIKATHDNIIDKLRSPLWNKRSDDDPYSIQDKYNGNRFLFEIIKEVRKNIPKETPLFIRLPDCDKSELPHGLTQWDTINICEKLVDLGIDVVDFAMVDKGSLNLKNHSTKAIFFQNLRKRLGSRLLFTCSSKIQNSFQAEHLIESGQEDIILCGRIFLDNPNLVNDFANELKVEVTKPVQYSWGFYPTEQYLENK